MRFIAESVPVSGTIVRIRRTGGTFCEVTVSTGAAVLKGDTLTIPDIRGGCGLADPRPHDGGIEVTLSIRYSDIDAATLWDGIGE